MGLCPNTLGLAYAAEDGNGMMDDVLEGDEF